MARSIKWQIDDHIGAIEDSLRGVSEDIKEHIKVYGDSDDDNLKSILDKIEDLIDEVS